MTLIAGGFLAQRPCFSLRAVNLKFFCGQRCTVESFSPQYLAILMSDIIPPPFRTRMCVFNEAL